jgi:hypothetical protein
MKTKFMTTLVIPFLASCGTMPRIDCEDAKKVHIGMTQEQVINLMGEPYFVGFSKDALTLGWQNNEIFLMSEQTLRVTMNPQTRIIKKIEGSCAQ